MTSVLAEAAPAGAAPSTAAAPATPGSAPVVRRGVRARDVEVDLDAHLVRVRGRPVVMTTLELRLCTALVAGAGRVLTRSQLAHDGWGEHPVPKKALDVYMSRIRRHLGLDAEGRPYIRTVRGIGYIFDA